MLKNKYGSFILSVTTDRRFNVLSKEITESQESIDYRSLVACLAEKYIEQNENISGAITLTKNTQCCNH